MLLSLDRVSDFLRVADDEFDHNPPPLIQELLHLLNAKVKGEKRNLTRLKTAVKNTETIDWATNGQQQDSAEFLVMLLQTIEEEVKDYPVLRVSFETLIDVVSTSQFICDHCGHVEDTGVPGLEEQRRLVPLPIDDTNNLKAAWDAVRFDTIPTNRTCQSCEQQAVKKVTRVSQYPGIFTAHLLRFDARGEKNTKKMIIPRQMKLSDTSPAYHLVGAGVHTGDTMKNGHYRSIIIYEDQTLLIDDDEMYPLKEETANRMLSEAYFFVYAPKLQISPLKKKQRLSTDTDQGNTSYHQLPGPLKDILEGESCPPLITIKKPALVDMYKLLSNVGPDRLTGIDLNTVKERDLRNCVIKKFQDLIKQTFPDDYKWQKVVASHLRIDPPKQDEHVSPDHPKKVWHEPDVSLNKMLHGDWCPPLTTIKKEDLVDIYDLLSNVGPDNLTGIDLNTVKERDLRHCVIKKFQDLLKQTFPDDRGKQKEVARFLRIDPPKKDKPSSHDSADTIPVGGRADQGKDLCVNFKIKQLAYRPKLTLNYNTVEIL